MRKPVLIFLVLFLLISLFFYAPVRESFFGQSSSSVHKTTPVSVITAALIDYYNDQVITKKIVRCSQTDITVKNESGFIYNDSSGFYATSFIKIANSELLFQPQVILPRGKKTVQFWIKPLTDSVQINFQTGAANQVQSFNNCRNELKPVIFQADSKENYPIRLNIKGEVMISTPIVQIAENSQSVSQNEKLLILDLPPNKIRELKELLAVSQWYYQDVIPFSYQPQTALTAFLYAQQPAVESALPQEYLSSAVAFRSLANSEWINSRKAEQQTIFAGSNNDLSGIVAANNLFDHTLLLKAKEFPLPELLDLAKTALAKSVGLFYLYQENPSGKNLSADNKMVADKLNDLIKQNLNLKIVLLSSSVPEFGKAPLLYYNHGKAAAPRFATLNDLVSDITITVNDNQKSKNHPTDSPLPVVIRDDSLLYFFQNDTTTRLSQADGNYLVQKFKQGGKLINRDAAFSPAIRDAYFKTADNFLKIISFENFSPEPKNYQLNISSGQNFYVLENSQIKTVNSYTINLLLNGKMRNQVAILYRFPEQIFNYSANEMLKAVYGSISLPVGKIDGFTEKSVLTPYSVNPVLRTKAELRIENFSLLPLWRYDQTNIK